jgi:carbon starvation protein
MLQSEAVSHFAMDGTGPVFAGKMFPFVFITVACGALSGFHALIASGTTPKMIGKESQVRMIGYGGMLMESFVAISALIAASVIDQGIYFAINSPGGATGGTPGAASEFIRTIGFTISPDQLAAAAQSVHETTLISRTGGAPTLAFGISLVFTKAFGGGLAAFWYHFAIMFEALFILTAVDAGTRVGRFMLQDTIGNFWPRYGDISWKPASWSASAAVVGAWGYFLYVGVNDPLGGIYQLFPLFGIANQLLAAIALTLAVTLLLKHGKARYVWVPGIALAWDLIITMSASWEKIFSSNPKIGFFQQRSTYSEALDQGKLLKPAKAMEDMQQIITNATVDGVLTVLFAVLTLVVIGAAIPIWLKAWKRGSLPTTEVPHVPSHLVAAAEIFTTAEEKVAIREYEESERQLADSGRELAGSGRSR